MDHVAALAHWAGSVPVQRLTGGHRNEVWLVEINGMQAILRHSSRPAPELHWEHDLLMHLKERGLAVPVVIPTRSGHRSVRGWHLLSRIDGDVLTDGSDARLGEALNDLHEATTGWPQGSAQSLVDT